MYGALDHQCLVFKQGLVLRNPCNTFMRVVITIKSNFFKSFELGRILDISIKENGEKGKSIAAGSKGGRKDSTG